MIHKISEFYKLFHQHLKLFPKAEKYSLGQKIENLTLEILELTFKVTYSIKTEKTQLLKDADAKIHLLKTLIRLAYEIRALDNKKYLALQEQLQEIGKMIGGWIKYSQS
ncbi:MAG: diversity-generating retroelement protein Avd [Patescibacteria group bacterium]